MIQLQRGLLLSIFSTALAFGFYPHTPPISSTAEFIPIPTYSTKYGPAGAENAFKAATALLASFDKTTKAKLVLPINADIRTKWSNLPAAFVERGGIKVGDMSKIQRKALFEFLSASLSPEGYEHVGKILAAEAFLSNDSRASRFMWAPENYWFAFYGTPHQTHAWGWQFGGHHLAINLSFENGAITSLSPTFLGTEPAVFTLDGVPYEVIVDLHAAGESIFNALDSQQQQVATYPEIPRDVLTGANRDGHIPQPFGLSAKEMTPPQRALLLQTINRWVAVQPKEHASPRMASIKENLLDFSFTWKGTTEINTPSYFRIQGPDLIIELLSTGGNVGQNAEGKGHYHTIYRVPSKEYGGAFTK